MQELQQCRSGCRGLCAQIYSIVLFAVPGDVQLLLRTGKVLQQTVQMRVPAQRCVQVLQHSVCKHSAVLRQIGVVLYEVSVGCVHLGGGCAEVEYVSCVYQRQCVRDVLVRTVCAQLVGAHGGHEVVLRCTVWCGL